MKNIVLSLFSETFIHPGCGQNDGAIDLPVARERATSYPFIAGSSHKGAWLDYAKQQGITDHKEIFGEADEAAGQLLISDARLLLLPIRSLQASYCWVTCPLLLERHARDWLRAMGEDISDIASNINIYKEKYIGEANSDDFLFLEERRFERENTIDDNLIEHLKKLIPYPASQERLQAQLVIISNIDFKWFVENGLPIQARNVLDDKKQSLNLWYEESLPPDTLFTSIIIQRDSGKNTLETLKKAITKHNYLQIGGNETVGQGWFMLGMPQADSVTEDRSTDNE